jgi:hypothetical protein
MYSSDVLGVVCKHVSQDMKFIENVTYSGAVTFAFELYTDGYASNP